MRRHAIGIIALVLLLAAVVFKIWPPPWSGDILAEGAFVRVGAIMAALWLAYPDVKRLPPWLLGAIPLLVVLLAAYRKVFLILFPIVIALAILKPRIPSRR